MRLTFHTDFALRVLVYLAVRPAKQCRAADIATSYGISRNHLLKVVLKLGKLGYITTARGRTGGITLARAPAEISLGAVVRDFEDDLRLVECMQAGGLCVVSPACLLKGVLSDAMNAFLATLDGVTLADVTKNRAELANLLNLNGAASQLG